MSQNMKRKEDALAPGAAIAPSADVATAQFSPQETESRDERRSKKAKTATTGTEPKSQNKKSKARSTAIASSVDRKKRLPKAARPKNVTTAPAANEDEEMSDAPEDDDRICANDTINNPYMPPTTEPAARAAYLVEVGNRYLHPSHTPLDTTGSKIALENRYIITDHVFLDCSNEQSLQAHQDRGGGTNSERGVSRLFHRWAGRWFEEQNVVMPWTSLGYKEIARLKKLGLGPENFPFVHPNPSGASAIPIPQSAPPPAEKKDTKPTGESKPLSNGQAHFGTKSLEELYAGRELEPHGKLKLHLKVTNIQQDDNEDDEEVHVQTHPLTCPHTNKGSLPMYDKIRAADNAADDTTTTLTVDEYSFMGNNLALIKHCGTICKFAQDNQIGGDFEVELKDATPVFVQAFIQAISPTPGHCLPKVPFEQGPKGQLVVAQNLHWDISACLAMRELAVELDCTVVNDMVTEQIVSQCVGLRIYRLIFDRLQDAKTQPLRQNEDFGITPEYVASLDAERDAAFIRFAHDCHRLPHSEALDIVLKNDRECRELQDHKPLATSPLRCGRWHRHGLREPCHTDLARNGVREMKYRLRAERGRPY